MGRMIDTYSGRREKKLELVFARMETAYQCPSWADSISSGCCVCPKFLEVSDSGLKISLDILFSVFPEETQMVTLPACQIEILLCSHLMTAI